MVLSLIPGAVPSSDSFVEVLGRRALANASDLDYAVSWIPQGIDSNPSLRHG